MTIMTSDNAPDKAFNDVFSPVKGEKRLCECLHCGKQFTEDKLIWQAKKPPFIGGLGMPVWWCPTNGCDGAGLGFDIFPVDLEN